MESYNDENQNSSKVLNLVSETCPNPSSGSYLLQGVEAVTSVDVIDTTSITWQEYLRNEPTLFVADNCDEYEVEKHENWSFDRSYEDFDY